MRPAAPRPSGNHLRGSPSDVRSIRSARPGRLLFQLVAFALVTGLGTAQPPGLDAQQGCYWEIVNRERGYTHSVQGTGGQFIHYVSGGIDYRCPDGARILADSAAIFQADNLAQLFGNVRFTDPDTELLSRRAFYYSNSRQLNAWEDIRLFDRENGAIITGDELVLNRSSPSRPLDRMVITGRAPHATVFLSEGGLESVVPYEVDAERFILEGRRYFRAGGGVVVDRATLHAVGDSLDFDQSLGVMSVFENARVQDANFDLTARTVTVLTPEGLVEEVLARENAELEGDGVFLEAPSVRMFVEANQVERLVALRRIPPIPGEGRRAGGRGGAAAVGRGTGGGRGACRHPSETLGHRREFPPVGRLDRGPISGPGVGPGHRGGRRQR